MEKLTKHLKVSSFIVILFALITLAEIAIALFYGNYFDNVQIPEGSPANIVGIAKTVILVTAVVFMIPQLYVGIKGIKVANDPDDSRAHIVWAVILFVLSVASLINAIVGIVNGGASFDNISLLTSAMLEVAIYFDYIKHARAVAKAI